MRDLVRVDILLRNISRARCRDLHRHIVDCRRIRLYIRLHENTDLAAQVDIGIRETLDSRETADLHVLADRRDRVLHHVLDRARFAGRRHQRVDIRRRFLDDDFRNVVDQALELLGLSHEVGFAVDFQQNRDIAFLIGRNDAFRRDPASLLHRRR